MSTPDAPHVVHVVATDAFAGVERYITYVAPLLADAGWRVTVIGGDRDRMSSAFADTDVEHIPYTGMMGLWRRLREVGRAADVVHTHMTAAEVAAVRAIPTSGPPIVTTRHFAANRGRNSLSRLATRKVKRRISVQIAISEFVASVVTEPTIVIPNGVPQQPFGAHDENVVLMVQRLEAEKHSEDALRAWKQTGLGDSGWELHIAGDGAERARLERVVRELGIERSVRFLGPIDDVEARMGRARIQLATAPREPFGLGVAEAMATGSAVVAVDGGGHRELLAEGVGVLVPVSDIGSMAAVIESLASSNDERQLLGIRAQARQRSEFSIERHVERLLDVYRSMLTI